MHYQTSTYRISLWASKNKVLARGLLIFSKLALSLIGLFVGIYAAIQQVVFDQKWYWWALAVASVVALLLYPSSKSRRLLNKEQFFVKQKRMDMALATIGLLFFVLLGNHAPVWVNTAPPLASSSASMVPIAESSIARPVEGVKIERNKGGRIKQWLMSKAKKRMERVIQKIGEKTSALDTLGLVLATLLILAMSIGLIYLIFGLACGLACSGQEALALIVLVFGVTATLSLAVWGIIAMSKNWKKRQRARNKKE